MDKHAVSVTSSNCADVVGASWKWVKGFCATHGVPTWRVGGRVLIPGHALIAAFERASREQRPESRDSRRAAERKRLADELKKVK